MMFYILSKLPDKMHGALTIALMLIALALVASFLMALNEIHEIMKASIGVPQ